MKVNEEKAKELIALADHWKKIVPALHDIKLKSSSGKDVTDMLGNIFEYTTKLIYETFPEIQDQAR